MSKRPDNHPQIDLNGLSKRLDAFPGMDRLRAAATGMDAYVVGGAVRDALLGATRADLDVVVEGDIAPLAAALGGELREHERFSTATVRDGDLYVDLARSRSESYEHPGALPDVAPAPLAEDLVRRDFSVNAIAVPLAGGDPIDPQGGIEDLAAGMLRVLHSRSFFDDPTRALRAARYAARLGLELEEGTALLLRGTTNLGTISTDRIDAELEKIAAEPQAARALELLGEWGVLDVDDYAGELVRRIDALVAEPPWKDFAVREAAVRAVASGADTHGPEFPDDPPSSPSRGRLIADGHTPEELLLARARGSEWLDDYAADWRNVELEIGGEALLAAGIEPGPAIGRGLAAALAAKLDGNAEGRDAELDVALRAARGD